MTPSDPYLFQKNSQPERSRPVKNLGRILAAAIAALFIVFGALYMFSPEGRMAASDLEAASELGTATMRALIGASFLTFGILLVMHTVIGQETGALRFAILFLLLSVIGRVVSLIVDGSSGEAVRNLVPVGLMLVVSVAALALFQRADSVKLETLPQG